MASYSKKIDAKWQCKWDETGLYKFKRERIKDKLYCLEMFSYPSGANLHIGHWWNFGLTDSWARAKRMQGFEVFEPMGFDAFGLPAENYAIKTGIHPQDSTMSNIETMRKQLRTMGAMFDWDYEVVTCQPDYYKWTQWLFLQLYKQGLAYRKQAPVNWCPCCNTSLANEQVDDGACERCQTEVTKKNLTQWFFKITAYADELIAGLEGINWPEKTKTMQCNWIGRSTGAAIKFNLLGADDEIRVFTTRADTLLGCTYVVLAPEHRLVDVVTVTEKRAQVDEYIEYVKKQSEIDRLSTAKEKTGVFTGAYALHPVTGERLPIWIADYVLVTYGTGAVMAVPGHDTRDYEFALKYELPIPKVIKASEDEDGALPFVEDGVLVNSGQFDGLTSEEARLAIVEYLAANGDQASQTINYRLRDWLVSRQRYWGAPIPVVYCDSCGIVPVPEADLPVLLPYDVDFTPDGISPLAKSEEFIHTPCPQCSKPAKRDTDTLDTFVCSSWYFLRYPDNRSSDKPWDPAWINQMLPVDMYVGGPEHAVMHLLYARFITKALRDMGYINFDEPFKSLVHQGIILGPDGEKMSKSKGNAVSPDLYIEAHGSDVFRLWLLFGFNYIEGGPWSDDGIKAVARFVERVERFVDRAVKIRHSKSPAFGRAEKEVNYVLHHAIRGITKDVEAFGFNTCISRLMELMNALYRYDSEVVDKDGKFIYEVMSNFVRLFAPFAPHLAEELWQSLGHSYSVHDESWPEYNEAALVKDTIELAVQVNGRIRDKIEVASDADEATIKAEALKAEKAVLFIEGMTVRKIIVIKGSLVNIVVS
ncbi:MAG: leucine--tRNA ligase [Peptococcaceae bacterium]|nr:leucine--tRNA ligase [Peptococcaceae bacterium]